MGQIAYRISDGEMVEAFSVSDPEWKDIVDAPRGTWLMPRSRWPAVPKTSIRGLRFFAHSSGYDGILPRSESFAHTRLKVDVVKAARALGYNASIEVFGNDPRSGDWIADVLVFPREGERIAFEIQLSSQHLEDFRLRTKRYSRCGIKCCWINSESPVGTRLAKAISHKNKEYYKKTGIIQADEQELLTFGVEIANKDQYPSARPLMRFGRGALMRRLQIDEAIDGIVNDYPKWDRPYWYWNSPAA